MTTFIDFRFLRALAEALFSGREQEEIEIFMSPDQDNHFVLDVSQAPVQGLLAEFANDDREVFACLVREPAGTIRMTGHDAETIVSIEPVTVEDSLLGVRVGPQVSGLKLSGTTREVSGGVFSWRDGSSSGRLRLVCRQGIRIMGQGSGRVARWGALFYQRGKPPGPCVELTMDWHHLRAGIPLFGTMTAEQLIEEGHFKLRFRSYAYDQSESQATDFVRLFDSSAPADVALHLTPSLYTPIVVGIPNVAFAVIESERINRHIVERCNAMDRVMVPTEFVRDALRKNGTTTPIEIVSHGVDADYFSPRSSLTTLPGGRAFNFLAIGTHVERKNFRHIVRAFLQEFREYEDVALYLLLRPEYMATQRNVVMEFTEWEKEFARDSAPVFIWTGYLTREHLRDFYVSADAYVMPSNEGFGLTLLEAMSCGTPVIALDYGGVRDFVRAGSGMLVRRGSSYVAKDIDTMPYVGDLFYRPRIGELRKAMRRMFESPDLVRRMGEQARQDAAALTWQRVGSAVSGLLMRACEDARESGQRVTGENAMYEEGRLTIVLCVLDDERAVPSLKILRTMQGAGVRAMCLFTRYARVRDVLRARRHGFLNYRWDGTVDNARSICRSVLGRHWFVLLYNGEKLEGDLANLRAALAALPPEVGELTVSCTGSGREPRIFHARDRHEPSEQAHYEEIEIR